MNEFASSCTHTLKPIAPQNGREWMAFGAFLPARDVRVSPESFTCQYSKASVQKDLLANRSAISKT